MENIFNSQQGPLWIGVGLVLALIVLFFNDKMRIFAKYLIRAAMGGASIIGINAVIAPMGIAVGINALTAAVTTFLGIPGIIMLYGISFFM